MRNAALSLLVGCFFASASHAAPPLMAGEIVVAGVSYTGFPAGACPNNVCRVNLVTGTTTPIGDPLPALPVTRLEVENRISVLVVTGSAAKTVYRLNVLTGAFAPLASGLPSTTTDITVAEDGRIFFVAGLVVSEIDRDTGAITTIATGPPAVVEWRGLDAESGGTLLTTEFTCFCPIGPFSEYSFVRIDPATGIGTTLADRVDGHVEQLALGTNGDRFVFDRIGGFGDGISWRWRPAVPAFEMAGGEIYQHMAKQIASDLDGHLVIGGASSPDEPIPLAEITRIHRDGGLLDTLTLDYGVYGLEVVPDFGPACADGIDDDGDGAVDYPADIGCQSAASNTENPRCDDGVDNDSDGTADWDGAGLGAPDSVCQGDPWRNRETSGGCGLGGELVLVLPLLAFMRRPIRAASEARPPRQRPPSR